MQYVSFDVATKSLAISIISYADTATTYANINAVYQTYRNTVYASTQHKLEAYIQCLDAINEILSKRIDVKYLDVIDLIPGKKLADTTTIERTHSLYNCLEKLRPIISPTSTFLIEYQMGPNDKSRTISSQIMYFCMSCATPDRIKLIGPSLKNTLSFNDPLSKHSYYTEKYSSNYTANKAHAKYNLTKVLTVYNQHHHLDGIKKKNLDDAADSVCMSIAFYRKYTA